jgi:methylenetetrahydrofolate reductase (NADPH)
LESRLKTFQNALAKGAFAVTAELSWEAHDQLADVMTRAVSLADYVDGIQLGENRGIEAQVSPTALAALLLREGIDSTPTINCRDRNRIALHSELLGLRALGVTSLVLNSGRPIPAGPGDIAGNVFDINGRELIAMAKEIDESGWLPGTDGHVPDKDSEWQAEPLQDRAAAGAQFLRLRPCNDLTRLRNHMARLVQEKVTWSYSVIVSLASGPAAETARMIEDVAAIPGVSGVNLLCPGAPGLVIESLKSSGRSPAS